MDPFISTVDLEAMLDTTFAVPTPLPVKIALDSACQRVRTYLGQTINLVEDDVEVHSGTGRRKLRLRERPVRAVTLVTIDDVETTNYTRRDAVLTLKNSDVWTYGNDNIEVTYDHGYDLVEPSDNNVPADIRLVALILARRVYESLGSVTGTVVQETIGDYSYQLSDNAEAAVSSAAELLEAEKYALDRYRIDLVGDSPTY